jgi:hypothetical protein
MEAKSMTTSPSIVQTPTGVRMIGYFYEDGADDEEIQTRALEIAKAACIEPAVLALHRPQDRLASLIVREEIAGKTVYQPVVKALLGRDYCVYMLILSARDDSYCAPLTEVMQELEHVDLDPVLANLPVQFDIQAYACREVSGTSPEAASLTLFADGDRPSAMSRCQGLALSFVCASWSRANRYVLIPMQPVEPAPPITMADQDRGLSQSLDDLAYLEVYRHKLRLSYEYYRQHYDKVEALDLQVNDEVKKTRPELEKANIAWLRGTLDRISERLIDLSRLTRAAQHFEYSANANRVNLESQLRDWNEVPVAGYSPLSRLFLPEAHRITVSLVQFPKRIESVRAELDSLVQVIRTRIELGQQQELIEMQHAMNVLEFLVLAGILFPFLQEVSPFMERIWESWAAAWMPPYGQWLPVVASLALSFLLLLIFVPLIDWIRDCISNFTMWTEDKLDDIT